MIKLTDNGKTNFYFDDYNMMLDASDYNSHGMGDALWRTSLALICSGLEELKESLYLCTKHVNSKIRFIRHPLNHDNDTSRDQSIMALIALKIHDYKEYNYAIEYLDFRISKKFTWQDAWFWAKENYLTWRIVSCYHFIGWWFEPSYSIHLFAWMLWSSKQKAPLIRWYLLKFIVHKQNYLIRVLLKDKITDEDKDNISRLKPMIDFRWQRDIPWLQGKFTTINESEYNCLDLEALNFILIRDYKLHIVNT